MILHRFRHIHIDIDVCVIEIDRYFDINFDDVLFKLSLFNRYHCTITHDNLNLKKKNKTHSIIEYIIEKFKKISIER